jgi:eukaryotic-like serine/threonine-protein kinase
LRRARYPWLVFKRGDRIGRYTIDRLLGEGGMGAAFLAHHEAIAGFKKKVVVKVLQHDKASDPVNVELFLREARVGGRLNHTSIVQIFDIGEERGAHFMAMEYVDGVTLLQATRRCWVQGNGLPMHVALRVIAAAAEGLHYAHTFKHHNGTAAGVVHRDLSPDNLMISREGTVKVLDFGVARIGGSEATKSGDLKGKIPYMPPEQLKADLDIDGRADLYRSASPSIGVCAAGVPSWATSAR